MIIEAHRDAMSGIIATSSVAHGGWTGTISKITLPWNTEVGYGAIAFKRSGDHGNGEPIIGKAAASASKVECRP